MRKFEHIKYYKIFRGISLVVLVVLFPIEIFFESIYIDYELVLKPLSRISPIVYFFCYYKIYQLSK